MAEVFDQAQLPSFRHFARSFSVCNLIPENRRPRPQAWGKTRSPREKVDPRAFDFSDLALQLSRSFERSPPKSALC